MIELSYWAQGPASTSAERYLLIYMVAVVLIISALVVIFFVVFQKRKNKLLIERFQREREFEEEIIKTQSEIQEQTLKHISWELHDNIGQLLAYANMQMKMLKSKVPEDLTNSLEDTNNTIKESLSEVRALSKSLNHDVLQNQGLVASLENEINRLRKLNFTSVSMDVKGQIKPLSNNKHEIVIFRILQEFFSNAIKYSEAEHLRVELDYQPDYLLLTAEDDGKGFDIDQSEKGSGLINMKSRAELIGADLNLSSQPGAGVQLILKMAY